MEITVHFFERWVERVRKVSPNAQMIHGIKTELTLEIMDAYKNAYFLWQGSINGRKEKNNFYLYNDIILISDTNKSALITCYHVELPFPESTIQAIIAHSVVRIKELRTDINKHNTKFIPNVKRLRTRMETIDQKIKDLQEQKKAIEQKITEGSRITNSLIGEVEQHARPLINSMTVTQDLLKGVV